jgi:hypothetical protein
MISELFKPTYLYIKQHSITGLKYFGKTTRKNPFTYTGSGIHWKRHIAKHEDEIKTLWCQLFTDKESLVEYALNFSKENNIVESAEWANLSPENGLDGAGIGHKMPESVKAAMVKLHTGKIVSEESRAKMSKSAKLRPANRAGVKLSDETKLKMSESSKKRNDHQTGRKRIVSAETKLKMSLAAKGKPKSEQHKLAISAAKKKEIQ